VNIEHIGISNAAFGIIITLFAGEAQEVADQQVGVIGIQQPCPKINFPRRTLFCAFIPLISSVRFAACARSGVVSGDICSPGYNPYR